MLPLTASADLNLVSGDTAQVAYTGGDGLTLRTAPGGDAIAYLPDGYLMTIQSGYWANDGYYWYSVSVDLASGWTTGYVLSDYVISAAGGSTFVYEGDAAASEVPIIVNTRWRLAQYAGEPMVERGAPHIDPGRYLDRSARAIGLGRCGGRLVAGPLRRHGWLCRIGLSGLLDQLG